MNKHLNGHYEQLKKNIAVILSSVTLAIGLIFGAGASYQKVMGEPQHLELEAFAAHTAAHDSTHAHEKELLTVELDHIKESLKRVEVLLLEAFDD